MKVSESLVFHGFPLFILFWVQTIAHLPEIWGKCLNSQFSLQSKESVILFGCIVALFSELIIFPSVYRDERQPFTDQSLYTADSENEEDKRRTKKAKVKMEESSGIEGVENEESQKPLNSMFVLMVILKGLFIINMLIICQVTC